MASTFRKVPIDTVRDFWDSRPCNIRHSDKKIGEKEYFEEVEQRKYFVEPHIPRFAEFERWKGKRVLEIGCGIGTDTMNFARAGADVTAVDLSDRSLEIARERARVLGVTNVRFVSGNAERLRESLAVQPYDLVYSFGVIHHTPNPDAALRELRRFLAPDGTLKLMLYHRTSWKLLWVLLKYGKGAFWKHDALIARWSEANSGCPVTYTFTRREIGKLLDDTGYVVDSMFVDHIFAWSIPEYVQHRYRKVWYFRALPQSALRLLEQRFGWHLCVTAGPKQ